MDSLCRCRAWVPRRRLVLELSDSAEFLAGYGQENGFGPERGGDAPHNLCSTRCSVLGHRDFQRGVFRTAIMVDSGHGSSYRPSTSKCGGLGSRVGRVWRGDWWGRFRTIGGLSTRTRSWVLDCFRDGGSLSRGCVCRDSGGDSSV